MDKDSSPIVFTPENEPYLGRASVLGFDQIIIACMEANKSVARYTHESKELNDLQLAATQIIPQGLNLALTIRELVRQGYLFGAAVLMRSLIERAAIISYLHDNPDEIEKWKGGWKYGDRPSLATMLVSMSDKENISEAQKICELFNHITHGDPIGSNYNICAIDGVKLGYSVGKNLNDTELCDFICFQAYCYLIVLMARMVGCFPGANIETN